MIHHYFLTRFNLALWQEDKNGKTIDRGKWLKATGLFRDLLPSCGYGADLPGVPLDIACGR